MQQIIDISTPDDGLGDVLREGFNKANQNFTELYGGKVNSVAGYGLTENDFTDADKTKLDGIETGAQVNVNSDFGENDPGAPGYIFNRPPSMYASVGYFDYNDLATQTTPLVLVSGVSKKLTNDALGVFTDLSQAPYGVATVWNSTTNQFDFSDLAIGDTLDLRVDALLTTTGTNKTYKIFLKLGIGTPSEFTTLVGSGELKSAVTDENIVKEISFYIGSEDVRDASAELYIVVDTSGSVKVNGWYTRILRKGLNIIDITTGSLLNDPTTYTAATLPLTGTEVAILNDGVNWVKITWNNIISSLSSVFQTILVSGTNIKTINGTSILGSGNLVVGGVGGARTYICEFGINQSVAAIPAGNTQWMHRTVQAGHNVSATWTLGPALDVSTSFANMFILTPCFSLPFQAKIKSVFVRGWHNSSNSTGVDFVVLKSHETGPTINGGITTVSNPLIVARENVQIWAMGAGNGFLKQFDGSSLTTTTLPLGSDIRLLFKNQNTNSAMYDTLVTVEFEEVI